MTHRQFTDDEFVAWRVLDVFAQGRDYQSAAPNDWPAQTDDSPASTRPTTKIRQLMATGWLVFQSARERRRLVPIPADWETVSEGEPGALCARAERVVLPPYSVE
jgi:hypothetical protein